MLFSFQSVLERGAAVHCCLFGMGHLGSSSQADFCSRTPGLRLPGLPFLQAQVEGERY